MPCINSLPNWVGDFVEHVSTVAKEEFCRARLLGTIFSLASSIYTAIISQTAFRETRGADIASTVIFFITSIGQVASGVYMWGHQAEDHPDELHASGLIANGILNALIGLVYFLLKVIQFDDMIFQTNIRRFSFGILMLLWVVAEFVLLVMLGYYSPTSNSPAHTNQYKVWRGSIRGILMILACGFGSSFGFRGLDWLHRVNGALRSATALIWLWSLWFELQEY